MKILNKQLLLIAEENADSSRESIHIEENSSLICNYACE